MPRNLSVSSVTEATRQFTEFLNIVLSGSNPGVLPNGSQINEDTMTFIRDCSVKAFQAWHATHLAERPASQDSESPPGVSAADESANDNTLAAASTSHLYRAPGIQSIDEIPRPSVRVPIPPANNQLLENSTDFGAAAQHDQNLRRRSDPQLAQFTASATSGTVPQSPATAP